MYTFNGSQCNVVRRSQITTSDGEGFPHPLFVTVVIFQLYLAFRLVTSKFHCHHRRAEAKGGLGVPPQETVGNFVLLSDFLGFECLLLEDFEEN